MTIAPPAPAPTTPGPARPAMRRGALAGVALAVAAVLALGWWGLGAERGHPTGVGDTVELDGGELVVTSAWTQPDPMALMHAGTTDKYAASGMSMSQMLPDAVGDGMKRVAVAYTLRAGRDGLRFDPRAVRLLAGGREFTPYTSLAADGRLGSGEVVNAVATFEVPDTTAGADFRLTPDGTVVHVDVSGGDGGHDGAGTDDHS